MRTRKVSVIIFKYPEDMTKSLSLKRLFEIDEELIFLDEFITDKSLDDLILQYRRKLERYAAFSDEVHCYRVILRDYESRRVFTAKL